MDFGRPHVCVEGVASQSKIRILDSPQENEDDIGVLVTEAANRAATELILGPNVGHLDAKQKTLVDLKVYKERVLPSTDKIEAGSLVVIMESFDCLDFVYATPGNVFNNRNGHFLHDSFIGKPFGCKVRSSAKNGGLGFVYLLRPTAELWARSLNHRTQIVHELDASVVSFYLELRPNMVVCESGTGSGAMSHVLARCIAPHGQLHTYEFNQDRAESARAEFELNQVQHLVTVHYHDVCGKSRDDTEDTKTTKGGFVGVEKQSVDAIFLDLPEPWWAIPHAAFVLKPNARIASYSPCVEQTQRACVAFAKHGFHSIRTIEVRLREHYADEVTLEPPPSDPAPVPPSTLPRSFENGIEVTHLKKKTKLNDEVDESKKNHTNTPRRTMQAARPFASMRGHTAFLTFATAGNKPQPDPNQKETDNNK